MVPIYIGALIAAIGYTFAGLYVKRAMDLGAGVTRYLFITNMLIFASMAICFGHSFEIYDSSRWPWIVLGGVTEFLGSITLTMAIRTGHVSVQAPLMGVKVLCVATFALFMIPGPIPLSWWIGAGLTFLGLFVLGAKDLRAKNITMLSVVYAISSSAFFALADVIVEREAPLFGPSATPICLTGVMAFISLGIIPFFRRSMTEIPSAAWRPLLKGASLMALQLMLLFYTISTYSHATLVNIVYNSRGILSVLAVWWIGHYFGNFEKDTGEHVLHRRLAGAILLMAAIVVTLFEGLL